MSILKALQSATSLRSVATILGCKPSGLSWLLYKKPAADKYKSFEIPKRGGGLRKISAPSPELKALQRKLADRLEACRKEIVERENLRDDIAHGFRPGRSIISNAKRHRGRRHVFNVDLSNFFGTINFGRVRGYLIKDKNFALNPKVATILAQIACHDNALPQGSPCSPLISNLIGHVLDVHLVRLCAKLGCVYTRYADDLTFSTNLAEFPTSIAVASPVDPHIWLPGKELIRLVALSGFEMNPTKTRMQYCNSRQEVTGLVVNRKVNVRSEYRRTVRSMVHRLFTTGAYSHVQRKLDANGIMEDVCVPGTLDQLHGMLGFIDQIDLQYKKDALSTGRHIRLSSKESVYRRFLMFKEFYSASRPTIICEGKTDNVYLVHAIRSLAAKFPLLASIGADGRIKLAARLYKYTGSSTGRILGLNGGTGDLTKFIQSYRSEMARFTAPGKFQPIIVLIDNDSGAGPIYSTIKEITKYTPTKLEPFIHITGNLYVCATPLPPGKSESMIEDFFDASTKAEEIGGKKFNPKTDGDTDKYYGKVVFAHKVVRTKADTINFNDFELLLTNISNLIEEHRHKFLTAPSL